MNERSQPIAVPTDGLSHEQLDRLGEFADTCDNLIAATELPMPADFHVNVLKGALADLSEHIKELYVEISKGDNPWK